MKTHAQKSKTKYAALKLHSSAILSPRWEFLALVAMMATISTAVGLSSCAGYTTSAAGTTTSSGTGILSASTGTVDFGNVPVGSSASQALTLTNTGTADVTISGVAASGSGFSVSGGNFTGTVAAGQSVTVQLDFAPQTGGSTDGTVTINSDASSTVAASAITTSLVTAEAATTSSFKVKLHGNATQSGISFSPSSLSFSNVPTGQTSSQTVIISNTGSANLQLKGDSITGNGFSTSGLTLPQTISPGQGVSFTVQYAPASAGSVSGSISFSDNAPNTPQTLSLTGTAVASSGTLSANPASFNFNGVVVGSSSQQTIALTNTGAGTVTINQVSTSGAGFSAAGISAGQTIAAGAQASFTATFAPTATGNSSGAITISTNASNPTLSIALSGTGTQGALSANPSSVSFGSVLVDSTTSNTITLTNTGTAPVSVSAASASGTGFSISGFTAGTLNPGATSSFTVTFAPTTSGSITGSISVTSNAPGSPLTIGLSGTGSATQPQLSINPSSVAFNSVNVGSNASQTVTLSNTGNATLNITAATITGSGYTMTLAPMSINAGANTTFTVTFAPTSAGSASGSISITSNAPGSPATIALSGTGAQGALSANPSSVSFGSVVVGSSTSTTVTLKNTGTAAVSVTAASASGTGFSMSGFTAGTLNPGATSSFTVKFAPTAAGSATGSVSVTSNAPGSPLTIGLSGTGTAQAQLSINPSSVSFGSVNVGSNASQTVTLSNTGNATLNITAATVTGSAYTMTLAPMSINAGANTTFTVTFTPASEGSAAGNISITSNASGSPATIALSGTGLQSLGSASPTSVAFGSVVVGNSNSDVITLKNTGNATLTFSQVSVSGTGFSISGLTTSSTIAAGASLNFNAIFSPTSATSSTGSIALTTNGSPSQISISLTGSGAAATKTLSSSSSTLSFGNVQVGSSKSLTATITNTGNSNVTISSVTVTGTGYTSSGITSGLILSPAQAATLTVKFSPTALGTYPGTVAIVSDATSSPTISLTGESHDVQLSWTASTSTGVTGYYVYRGTQSGQYTKIDPSSPATSTQFTDTTVAAGTTYYYVVTAVDSSGVESTYSSPSTVSVP